MNEPSSTAGEPSILSSVRDTYVHLHRTAPNLFRSPGRINLIGEHTDYNQGFVIPAGIDRAMYFAIGFSDSEKSTLHALKTGETFTFDIRNPERVDHPAWANYLLGVISAFINRGLTVRPLHCVFDGNVPTGAGLSSSAALECGFAFGINHLHNYAIPRVELVHMAQWSEHNYVGVKCGIMDQFASIMSRAGEAFTLDCRSLEYAYFPLALGDLAIVLCDTMVKHSLASSEYNTRRQECEAGVLLLRQHDPSIQSLRDVTLEQLDRHREELSNTLYNRCRYVVEENARVKAAARHLENGDLKSFGQRMYESHHGLSTRYEVSCRELDFLVDQAKSYPGVIGSRMMGGGFGGCTINLVPRSSIDGFISTLGNAYKDQFAVEMGHYVVDLAEGTSAIW